MANNPKLAEDRDSNPIQMILGNGLRVNEVATTTSSSALVLPVHASMVIIRSSDYVWLRFGNNSVVAADAITNIMVPPGEGVYEVPAGSTHFAIKMVAGTGTAQFQLEGAY